MSSYYSVILKNENGRIIVDGEKACRACLSTECKLIDLFSNNLAEQLSELTGTAVELGDGLPQQLCTFCCQLLRKGAAFRKKCRSVVSMFQNIWSNHVFASTTATGMNLKGNIQNSQLKIPLGLSEVIKMDIPESSVANFNDTTSSVKVEYVPQNMDYSEQLYTIKKYDDETGWEDEGKPLVKQLWKIENDVKVDFNNDSSERAENMSEELMYEELEDMESDDNVDASEADCSGDEFNGEPMELKIECESNDSKHTDDMRQIDDSTKKLALEKKLNMKIEYFTKEEEIRNVNARQESSKHKLSKYKCKYCYKGFMNEDVYTRHMVYHDSSNGKHKCDICQTYFDDMRAFRIHMRSHKIRLTCQHSNCGFVFRSIDEAQHHCNMHKDKKCKECGKSFRWKSSHSLHLRKEHGSTSCNICTETFRGERGLKAHMQRVHAKAMEYRCSTCGVQFLSSDAYRKHVDTAPSAGCTDVRPCEHCGVNLPTEDLLLQHLQTEHEMKLRCDMCGLLFRTVLLLNKHCYGVHGYRCRRQKSTNKVEASPKRCSNLKVQNIMCETCGRYFKCNAALQCHQRIHTGEKPFQCTVCFRRFRINELLKLHMYTHTGETPYKCPHCPKAFATPSNRDRHRVVHTKEKRYPCPLCDRMFQQSCYVKIHIKTAHFKEPWPKRIRPRRRVTKLS